MIITPLVRILIGLDPLHWIDLDSFSDELV